MTNGEKTQEKRTKKLRPIGLAKGKVSRGQDFNKPLKLSVRDRDVLKKAVEYYIGTETETKKLRAEIQKLHAAVKEGRAVFGSLRNIKIRSTAPGAQRGTRAKILKQAGFTKRKGDITLKNVRNESVLRGLSAKMQLRKVFR